MFSNITTLKVRIFASSVQNYFLVHIIKKLKPNNLGFLFKPTICFSKVANSGFKDVYGINEAVNRSFALLFIATALFIFTEQGHTCYFKARWLWPAQRNPAAPPRALRLSGGRTKCRFLCAGVSPLSQQLGPGPSTAAQPVPW